MWLHIKKLHFDELSKNLSTSSRQASRHTSLNTSRSTTRPSASRYSRYLRQQILIYKTSRDFRFCRMSKPATDTHLTSSQNSGTKGSQVWTLDKCYKKRYGETGTRRNGAPNSKYYAESTKHHT
jgi:hypothetical protein